MFPRLIPRVAYPHTAKGHGDSHQVTLGVQASNGARLIADAEQSPGFDPFCPAILRARRPQARSCRCRSVGKGEPGGARSWYSELRETDRSSHLRRSSSFAFACGKKARVPGTLGQGDCTAGTRHDKDDAHTVAGKKPATFVGKQAAAGGGDTGSAGSGGKPRKTAVTLGPAFQSCPSSMRPGPLELYPPVKRTPPSGAMLVLLSGHRQPRRQKGARSAHDATAASAAGEQPQNAGRGAGTRGERTLALSIRSPAGESLGPAGPGRNAQSANAS